jgi:hypothetical protein
MTRHASDYLRTFAVAAAAALMCAGAIAQRPIPETRMWQRVSFFCPQGTQVPVLSVPATATRPYFLRQTIMSHGGSGTPGAYSGMVLQATDATQQTVAAIPLMFGTQTELAVPFNAGEQLKIHCYYNTDWVFIFSY